MQIESQWKAYIGVSCTTIQNGTDTEILVFLPEVSPMHTGDVENVASSIEFETFDALKGVKDKDTIAIAQCVKAKYFGRDNMTVPCVHRGELVEVITYGGLDVFYWRPTGQHTEVRNFERLRIFVQDDVAIIDKGQPGTWKNVDADNTYYIELDTRPESRGIFIRTCRNNGEAFRYDIAINTIANTVRINDDANNWIELDSNIPQIVLHNNHESTISLIKDVINIGCLNTINITAPNIITTCEVRTTLVEKADTLTVKDVRKVTVENAMETTVIKKNTTTIGEDTLNVETNRTTTIGANDTLTVGTAYTVNCKLQTFNCLEGTFNFIGNNFNVATKSGSISWLP